MTVKERIKTFISSLGLTNQRFESECGLSNGYIANMRKGVGDDALERISNKYPTLSKSWLLTGEGAMLKNDCQSEISINYQGKGVPYYDVDFIGGFDMVFNDQTQNPTCHINFPQYNSADFWVNVTGHSMEPEISHGDMIAIKELQDWNTHILFGEMYATITTENRTIKYVRRSKQSEDFLRLIPVNLENFDEQDIPKSIIIKVFKVLGAAKKIQ